MVFKTTKVPSKSSMAEGLPSQGLSAFPVQFWRGTNKTKQNKTVFSSGAWSIQCSYSSNSTPDSQHTVAENVDFLKQVGTSTQSVLTLPCTPVDVYIDMVVSLNFRNLITPHC